MPKIPTNPEHPSIRRAFNRGVRDRRAGLRANPYAKRLTWYRPHGEPTWAELAAAWQRGMAYFETTALPQLELGLSFERRQPNGA